MTRIYLAYSGVSEVPALAAYDWAAHPISLLVAFPHLKSWNKCKREHGDAVMPEALMLDSGAYTAFTMGHTIDIDELLKECANPLWDEVVGLDVIGSWEGSKKNIDHMSARGCPRAMPVFHIGDPWDLLEYYCKNWAKVGLACSVLHGNSKEKYRFYDQCFAKAWPHRFHSFGWTGIDMLLRYPFHSADSSSWSLMPRAYNSLKQYGRSGFTQFRGVERAKIGVLIPGEMAVVAEQQRQVAARWDKELKRLEE